jgi:short subunit dehydrogenase-like uncharacterized protein
MKNIEYDLVIMGATGFTGKLVVEYLIENYGVENEEFTWAIAGRDINKLERLRSSFKYIDSNSNKIPRLVVDSHDTNSLDKMTSISRLVISTVGPYLKFGEALVESCVKNGTHYCDLTGEVPFIRKSIDAFDIKAKKNNCRIVHSCGFDSVPSDIGVLLLQMDSLKRFDKPCDEVNLYVRSIRGGLSGGTIDSMISIFKYMGSNPGHRKLLKSPFSLNPRESLKNNTWQPILKSVKWDDDIQRWLCPFIMAGFNSRIVMRTNAITDYRYGIDFKYSEVSSYKKGLSGFLKAVVMFIGLVLIQISLKVRPLLWFLRKFFLPSPGEGPSKEIRDNGFFKLDIIGSMDNIKKIRFTVTGEGDPGYSATAKMITESALSILLNQDRIPKVSGVLTPAAGIGVVLAERLNDKGFNFSINE